MKQSTFIIVGKPVLRTLLIQGVLIGLLFALAPMMHVDAQAKIGKGDLPTVAADDSTIQTVFQIVFGIIGAFAVLSITASGFKYITAAGEPQKISEAKKGVAYALVGLAIAISAEAIVTFLISFGS